MATIDLTPLDPPERLLCGPGPTNVGPEVLAAMQRPMLGHLDPAFHDILLVLVERLRAVFRASEGIVLPLQATGTSGMEAGLANLLEPSDTAVVGVAGYFGQRIADMARRYTDDVVEVRAPWGEPVPNDELLEALDAHPNARLLAVVHAETSTGVEHPLAELAAALRGRDTLLMVDCVTSLGGIEVDIDGWGVDYAYSCTQKCLGAPPGLSPVAVSDRALARVHERSRPGPFSFDFDLLQRYWVDRPAIYHHTAPILQLYALHEALRLVLEEGLQARWERHAAAAEHLRAQLRERGLDLLANPAHQLPQLTAVRLGEGVDGKEVQGRLLRDHGIEIGGGLGPSAPAMWRIGLMGVNARPEVADRVIGALDAVGAAQMVLGAG